MTQQLHALLRLFRTRGPEGEVSKRWLFRTGSRLDCKFRRTARLAFAEKAGFVEISIDNQLFLWPSGAPKAGIEQILSEILTPIHPHQYIYGPTQIDGNDVVLDIGACEGAFSAFVTGRCKSVIAVEPSKSMCSLMAELFKRRSQTCPTILNCLLGSEKAVAYFYEDPLNPGASRITANPIQDAYQVPVTTLDDALLELEVKPSFIKCDAEGAEQAIFSGGKQFLSRFRPKLAITTYHNDNDFTSLYTLLTELGYNVMGKGFVFSHGNLRVQMIHAW